jgi:hypothetical protein
MKGVILLCLIYCGLPIGLLALFSLLSSGFPVFPLVMGVGLFIALCRDSNHRGSHY